MLRSLELFFCFTAAASIGGIALLEQTLKLSWATLASYLVAMTGGGIIAIALVALDHRIIQPRPRRQRPSALMTDQEAHSIRQGREPLYHAMFTSNTAVKLLIEPGTGAIIDANPAAERYYGYTKAQLQALTISDINTLSKAEVHAEMALAKQQQRLFFRFRHRLCSGEVRDVEVYSGPLSVMGRTLLHSIVVDVTDRNRLEERLTVALKRLELALQSHQCGIWDYQCSSTAQEASCWYSAQIPRLLGYGVDERRWTLGRIIKRVYPEDWSRFAERWRHVRAQETTLTMQLRLRIKEGSYRWFEVECSLVRTPDQRIQQIIGLVRDIDAAKRSQALIEQRQKLETVGHLAGGVAHDFNNLLQVIGGNVELLSLSLSEGASADNEALIDSTLSAVENGRELNEELLSFARREKAGGNDVSPAAFGLSEAMGELKAIAQRTLPDSIALIIDSTADDLALTVDKSLLKTALLNLIINARDAMPDRGGKIILSSEVISIAPGQDPTLAAGHYLLLRVTDNGHGMSAAVLNHCLEPFFTTKPKQKGTGMGLSLAYSFCHKWCGDLRVESQLGQGTTISLYLPCAQADPFLPRQGAPTAARLDPPTLCCGRGESILVVEDRAEVRLSVELILRRIGYYPIAASDGDVAKQIISEGTAIDLVFSDVLMPGAVNGVELRRWVLSNYPQIKVLLTTGYSEESLGIELNGMAILRKPYTISELAQAIAMALAGDPSRRQAGVVALVATELS